MRHLLFFLSLICAMAVMPGTEAYAQSHTVTRNGGNNKNKDNKNKGSKIHRPNNSGCGTTNKKRKETRTTGGTTNRTPSNTTTSRDRILSNLISNMIYVEGGTFTMGATSEQGSDANDDEKPAHQVTVSSFSIGKYEVTQEEWEAVMGSNPSKFKGAKLPVEQVSWNDCQTFIRKLNQLTGRNFRLPTEAEWEYAARGGRNSRGYKYAGTTSYLDGYAWYCDNSGSSTHTVGQKNTNELGLYDMSGNVWEWCADWYGHYSSSAQTNPQGPSSGSHRVCRGGNWLFHAEYCRASSRLFGSLDGRSSTLGLRLAL